MGLPALLAGCSTIHSTEAALIGKWQSTLGGETICYEFLPNHACVYTQSSPKMTWRGHFEVESPNMAILTKENFRNAQALQFVLKGNSLLRIVDGSVEEFRRVDNQRDSQIISEQKTDASRP